MLRPFVAALIALTPVHFGCSSDESVEPPPPDATGGRANETLDGEAPGAPSCEAPAGVSDGELQNRASGPSVFGSVRGTKAGWADPTGTSDCGVAGVRVCRHGTDLCTETDAAGQYVLLGLPEDEDLEISFEREGLSNTLRLLHSGASPLNLNQTRILEVTEVVGLFAKIGIDVDIQKGALTAVPLTASDAIGGLALPENVAVSLKPSGPDPFYSVGAEKPGALSSDALDPALRATRSGGWSLFVNVEPGEYAVHFERNGVACNQPLPGYGYGADANGNIRIKVFAGYSTATVAAFCP